MSDEEFFQFQKIRSDEWLQHSYLVDNFILTVMNHFKAHGRSFTWNSFSNSQSWKSLEQYFSEKGKTKFREKWIEIEEKTSQHDS